MPFARISERMKLVVPLTMPTTPSMRLAVSPSRSALMIGRPRRIRSMIERCGGRRASPWWSASVRVALAVVLEELRDAADRIRQIVGIRQEHDAQVIRPRPVEPGALHDQHLLLRQQLVGE